MPMETPERALCIRLKLVLIFGVIDHSLRIVHDDAAVGETALQNQVNPSSRNCSEGPACLTPK